MTINCRLTQLCHRLTAEGIGSALLLHHRDILYYAGTVRPAVLLVVPRPDISHTEPLAVLFVRRGLEYARREATVARIEPMGGFSSVVEFFAELELTGGVLGTELDLIPANLYLRLREAFPTWSMVDISPLVMAQRMVKDEDEIAAIRRATAVADAGHAAAAQTVALGVTELELAAEVEAAMRRAGHEGFQPLRHPAARGAGVLVMSGAHMTVRGGHGLVITGMGQGPSMPYGPSRRALQLGDLVVVDTGSTCDGYTGDESRTFVVGPASDSQQALFAACQAIEDAVFEALRPGVPISDLYPVAEAVAAEGAPPYFPPGSLMLPGFVGHGVGLEIDEPPVLWPRDEGRLEEGMVLAIEIEVSAPGPGMMVKLEDTVVVRHDGCEVLTTAPRHLLECA